MKAKNISLWDGREIIENKSKVINAFNRCYKRSFPDKSFHQLYEKNPYGEPLSLVIIEDEKIVSFYALHPQILSKKSDKGLCEKKYFLGTTLMVDPSVRGITYLGSLMEAAKYTLDEKEEEFILGFPNQNSYLPLVELFNWELALETEFQKASVNAQPEENFYIEDYENEIKTETCIYESWSAPYYDNRFIDWKKMRYDYNIKIINDNIIVVYKVKDGKALDIVDLYTKTEEPEAAKQIISLVHHEKCDEIIITNHHAKKIDNAKRKFDTSKFGDPIRMCTFPFQISKSKLNMSLLLSDIF